MPRRLRDTYEGLFHVTAHSVREEDLFCTDTDRQHFLRELARATARTEWTCVGYCLMNTHFHLILEVSDGALPRGMHCLNFRYAMWFNLQYAHRGHVFSARYWSRRVHDEGDLLTTFRYVMRNPVEAFACESPADWPWSSYAETVGLAPRSSFVDPAKVLACFGGPPELRLAALRHYVEDP